MNDSFPPFEPDDLFRLIREMVKEEFFVGQHIITQVPAFDGHEVVGERERGKERREGKRAERGKESTVSTAPSRTAPAGFVLRVELSLCAGYRARLATHISCSGAANARCMWTRRR